MLRSNSSQSGGIHIVKPEEKVSHGLPVWTGVKVEDVLESEIDFKRLCITQLRNPFFLSKY